MNRALPQVPPVGASFVAELVVRFKLPGVRQISSGNRGQDYQMESHGWHESWTMAAENASETAAVFRAVAEEIERVTSHMTRAPEASPEE